MNPFANSGILYVRANLVPFARAIRAAGSVPDFLGRHFTFSELVVPFFSRARIFWRPRPSPGARYETTSGALGTQVSRFAGAVKSPHPSHAFTGYGPRVAAALQTHDHHSPCFQPLRTLAECHDFSMLLMGCLIESPGFSTVHVTQNKLGLTKRHLIRFIYRWDFEEGGRYLTKIAPESPGCSLSFGEFYRFYRADGNLIEGQMEGQPYLFVPSARRALASELAILEANPRFVDCERPGCVTCRFRTY